MEEERREWIICDSVKEIKEALAAKRDNKRHFNAIRFDCGERLDALDSSKGEFVDEVSATVEGFGGTEEDLIGVLNWCISNPPRLDRALDVGDGSSSAAAAAAHIDVLKAALVPQLDIRFIHFAARVACRLGIPSDRMQRVAEGIAPPQQGQDIGQIEVQRFAKLLMMTEEFKVLKLLIFNWEGKDVLTPPQELELAFAQLDCLTDLQLWHVGNPETLLSQLLRKAGNNLKHLWLERNRMTVEGFGKLSRDLASQECKVEELAIVLDEDIDKEGWEQAFQNGICNKLIELKALFPEGAGEALFKALTSPNCSLQRLYLLWETDPAVLPWVCKALQEGTSLSVLDCRSEDLSNATGLGEALSSAKCGLEELIVTLYPGDGGGWLGRALQNPNCKLIKLKLSFRNEGGGVVCDSSLWSALSSPHFKLRHLEIWSSREDELTLEFAEGIEKSQLEHLDIWSCKITNGELFWKAITSCKYLKALSCESELPWRCLLGSSIEDLRISQRNFENLEDLCQLLGDPKCKLLKFRAPSLRSDAQKRQILAALEENYQSLVEELDIGNDSEASEAFKQRCSGLLERNAIFQQSAFKDFDNPSTAKLFLCGASRVGKTTIKKNLCRRVSWFPSCLQTHASTAGIELQPLVYATTKQKLLICDLAGQEEFHAFHQYFLRGSEKDLFLIVCKVEDGNCEVFKQNLVYWLRFIASHQSASPKRKPRVLIALNFFTPEPDFDPKEVVSAIISDKGYGQVLEFGNDFCFKVVATQVKDLRGIKTMLGSCLEELLSAQQQIPQECLKAKRKLVQDPSHKKVIPLDKVGKILLPHRSSENVLKFVLQFLHDSGDAIYFGLGHEEDDIVSQFVILDVQWFIKDVVQLFIPTEKTSKLKSRMDTHQVKHQLKQQCGNQDKIVEYILGVLHEMGVILPWDDTWDGNWHNLPKELIMPTLLQEDYSPPGYLLSINTQKNHNYWGRRFECKDKDLKLFPASIFTKIQVKLHRLSKKGFRLGNGWVALKKNLIEIIVRVGGDTDNWKDRQWIDIIIYYPKEVENTPRPDLEKEAEGWMEKIRNCIIGVCMEDCPSLEIEENVMRRGYVWRKILNKVGKLELWASVICPLKQVKCKAKERGLEYSHTWNYSHEAESWDVNNDLKVSDENALAKLLMPNEQKHEMVNKFVELHELLKDYEEVGEVTIPKASLDVVEFPNVEDPKLDAILRYFDKRLDKMENCFDKLDTKLDNIEVSFNELKNGLKSIMDKVNAIHTRCLQVLLKLETDCPKYPYILDENNRWKNYSKILGTPVKLHYLCEWHEGSYTQGDKGHQVKNSVGVELNIPPNWLKKFAPVLKHTLILLFIGAKVGGHFAGAGEIVNAMVDETKGRLISFLDSCLLKSKLTTNPKAEDLYEIFKLVTTKVGKEEKQETIMETYFALHPTILHKRKIWVCKADHQSI
ncbi:protein TORNADO 1 isoform X1 [Selaginella moellendorffii]|uniref:protein TORNADO 1 isoform X1 n=1 Tax=Selaginella moellendorffii TaxID=88036 RepID=UPI000D1CCBD0|nr:protein TORNADO 1 isoform X1 [Selaginella moellendorffii]|eukprot:XP_024540649.1 protein TORNADO 1 isoform X1 [Selaginella moellendorffii]